MGLSSPLRPPSCHLWQEILVDYGGSYFEKDSSEDSDMHDSDSEFEGKSGGGKRRRGAAARPQLKKPRKGK